MTRDKFSAEIATQTAPLKKRRESNAEIGLPRLLDITSVADHLGVTVRHVRRLVAERRIPFIKWGHLLRFDPDEVTAWIDESRCEPRRAG